MIVYFLNKTINKIIFYFILYYKKKKFSILLVIIDTLYHFDFPQEDSKN